MRIAVLTRGLTNPLSFMWPEVWRTAGHDVVHVDFETAEGHGDDGSVDLADMVLPPPGPMTALGRRACEQVMGGAPDVLFTWWGTGSLEYASWASAAWPNTPIVLCVDTFPNASRPITEMREVLELRRGARAIGGLVYFSEEMRDLHRRRAPRLRGLPNLVTVQPIPDRAFARPDELDPEHPATLRVCFTGRADYLFSTDPRMGKDALGSTITDLERAGIEIWVQERGAPDGLRTYPSFTTQEVLDGTFATHVGGYDGQLALYRQSNRTLRRRVRCGLSSRFGLGPVAPSLIVVPQESTFALRIIEPMGLGLAFEGADALADRLRARSRASVLESWERHRQSFSASHLASDLNAFLAEVVG